MKAWGFICPRCGNVWISSRRFSDPCPGAPPGVPTRLSCCWQSFTKEFFLEHERELSKLTEFLQYNDPVNFPEVWAVGDRMGWLQGHLLRLFAIGGHARDRVDGKTPSGRASSSRAVRHLVDRGLVVRRGREVEIAPLGWALLAGWHDLWRPDA